MLFYWCYIEIKFWIVHLRPQVVLWLQFTQATRLTTVIIVNIGEVTRINFSIHHPTAGLIPQAKCYSKSFK